ncbi:uncharacterized protein LOC141673820 [Apium graveolens]|uniref:uncharacterized protein LOC141673820 n=1 Tax=Apium graveolens TaxID=4045 RepID=UPI003D79EB2F
MGGVNEGLVDGECVHTVTNEYNENLLMHVTSEEVKKAVFSMYPEKAPGIDGLNSGFFQAYWDIVADDVIHFCRDFTISGMLPDGINKTLVCLIPKIKYPKQMTDYRSIAFIATHSEASTMKAVLNRYERCSGQAINYRKSSITFSPNTSREDRTWLCTSLEVEEVDRPGKYLGMPMFVGKNKCVVFGFLAEKIPHSIYDDIEKVMNGFWWGKGSSGKGIRWLSWENLSNSKMIGGLGAKYYHKVDFLNAEIGGSPSYIWRSILAAKDVLKKVPWLPDKEDGCVSTDMPVQLRDTKVQCLMDMKGRNCDEEVLCDIFNDRDIELIRKIPIPVARCEDTWFWLRDEDDTWKGCKFCLESLQGMFTNSYGFNNKKVNISDSCPWFHTSKETDMHILFHCDFAKTVKNQSGRNVIADKKCRKPPEDWFKVNVDEARACNGYIGFGCVIRNSQGKFIGARCGRIRGNWSPKEAEALSLKEAIIWTRQLSLDRCIFETDSQSLASACYGEEGCAYFNTIEGDCKLILKHFNHMLVKFAFRSANCVAHELARTTHSMSDLGEWHVTPPIFLNHVLEFDLVF